MDVEMVEHEPEPETEPKPEYQPASSEVEEQDTLPPPLPCVRIKLKGHVPPAAELETIIGLSVNEWYDGSVVVEHPVGRYQQATRDVARMIADAFEEALVERQST